MFKISAIAGFILCFAVQILAHTFHTSLTRIDYNEKSKTAEISIQLFSHDLIPALEKLSKKGVDLEKNKDADALLLKYLDDKFIVQNAKGEKQTLKFVGKELEADTVYVYVEIPLADSLETYSLQDSLFFESYEEQTNLVTAHDDGKKIDLIYKPGDRFKQIAPEANGSESRL